MNSTTPTASTPSNDANIYIMLAVVMLTSTLQFLLTISKTIKKSTCCMGEVEFRSSEPIRKMEEGRTQT